MANINNIIDCCTGIKRNTRDVLSLNTNKDNGDNCNGFPPHSSACDVYMQNYCIDLDLNGQTDPRCSCIFSDIPNPSCYDPVCGSGVGYFVRSGGNCQDPKGCNKVMNYYLNNPDVNFVDNNPFKVNCPDQYNRLLKPSFTSPSLLLDPPTTPKNNFPIRLVILILIFLLLLCLCWRKRT